MGRGSIPKPGPTSIHYGGNTLCHELRTARGTLVIIDCGTGLHGLGLKLLSGGGRSLAGHILISHTYWDHIQGVPFFAPFFAPGNKWDIYGPKGLNQSLRDMLAGQMQHTYFPITPDEFGASIRYHVVVTLMSSISKVPSSKSSIAAITNLFPGMLPKDAESFLDWINNTPILSKARIF